MLHHFGCRFALHRGDLPGRPDIVMPARGRIVLVNGCFWHGHSCARGRRKPATNARYWQTKLERNKTRDCRALTALRRAGWRVLVLWECQTTNPSMLAARLSRFLSQ
jgi:DNA mismatch endonuclease (patch repair protein)